MRELTVMQAACWFGRNAGLALGGVAAHLYAEFDSSFIDGERLRAVLARLCRVHPMLSLRVDGEGRQTMAADRPILIEMDDFRELSADAREQTLLAKRHQWSHQQLKLQQEPPVRVSLTRIDDEMFRLHIDADMMAVDPSSFRLLVEDFALFYENPDVSFSPPPSFFNWCDVARSAPGLKAIRVEDRAWWRARLTEVAPAPSLPYLPSSPSSDVGVESTRLHLHLGQPQLQALRGAAAQQCVTLSSLMLSLFALSLGQATGDTTFRLNVPIFRRPQVMDGEERIIGEFADMVILDIHLETARDPGELCRNVAQQMAHLIAHRGYSGIEVMRDLSRHRGTSQTPPVVFTAAVDLPGGNFFPSGCGAALVR